MDGSPSIVGLLSIGAMGANPDAGLDLSFPGSAGNVLNGPSCTLFPAGGRPLAFAPGAFAEGQALDTAGPCLRRLRADGVMADLGSLSKAASMCAVIDVGMAVIG